MQFLFTELLCIKNTHVVYESNLEIYILQKRRQEVTASQLKNKQKKVKRRCRNSNFIVRGEQRTALRALPAAHCFSSTLSWRPCECCLWSGDTRLILTIAATGNTEVAKPGNKQANVCPCSSISTSQDRYKKWIKVKLQTNKQIDF